MLVMPANAAPMRMSTPDALISVPIQPRKLARACIIPGWSMTFVQHRGSFHWTRHAVWYSWRSTARWVCCIPKLLRVLWRYIRVVITVSGWAGGESIIGPNTTSVLGFWAPINLAEHWNLPNQLACRSPEHDCCRLKLWLFSRQSCHWKQRWVHLKWPENDQNIRNI